MRWLLLGLISLQASTAVASEVGDPRSLGLGVILGHPTGLSGKVYLGGRTNAIDAALAFDTRGERAGWFYAHASYLWHPMVLVDEGAVEVPWHVGIGGVAASDRGFTLGGGGDPGGYVGARVPVGVDVDFRPVPVQVFVDVALEMVVLPRTEPRLGLSLGARYYF